MQNSDQYFQNNMKICKFIPGRISKLSDCIDHLAGLKLIDTMDM
jgi:hypothetical protein